MKLGVLASELGSKGREYQGDVTPVLGRPGAEEGRPEGLILRHLLCDGPCDSALPRPTEPCQPADGWPIGVLRPELDPEKNAFAGSLAANPIIARLMLSLP